MQKTLSSCSFLSVLNSLFFLLLSYTCIRISLIEKKFLTSWPTSHGMLSTSWPTHGMLSSWPTFSFFLSLCFCLQYSKGCFCLQYSTGCFCLQYFLSTCLFVFVSNTLQLGAEVKHPQPNLRKKKQKKKKEPNKVSRKGPNERKSRSCKDPFGLAHYKQK
jgi:hypothetical protein